MTIPAGRCSNGNAVSSIPSRARRKARRSSTSHLIRVTDKAFDDFAGGEDGSAAKVKRFLGLGQER